MPNYDFNAARKLYATQAHPRIMLGADDLAALKQKIKRGVGAKIMTDLRRRVRPLVDAVHAADTPAAMEALLQGDGSHNSMAAQWSYAIDSVAIVAAIDEDPSTISAILRVFDAVLSPDTRRSRISVALLAEPFDMLYDHIDADLRDRFVAAANDAISSAIARTDAHYYKSAGGNITLITTLSVISLILASQHEPGARDFNDELADLVTKYEATINTAVTADGYPEEDIGYGTHVTSWLIRMGEMMRRAGVMDWTTQCPRLLKFGQSILPFVQPWGEVLSNTGDHGSDFGKREFPLARLATLTQSPQLLWLLGTLYYTHGMVLPENTLPDYWIETTLRKGFRTPADIDSLLVLDELAGAKRPTSASTDTSYLVKRRGLASFRSGWGDDDAFVTFDGSQRCPAAQGHFHASCGHFSLTAVGEYFSIDTGRYNNEQSCHSLVLVDGKPGRTTNGQWAQQTHAGMLTDYVPHDICDYAAVDSSHQHDCFWAQRHMGLVKGKGARPWMFVVDDINKCNDWAEYWWQLQTSPENTIATKKKSATITGWRCGNKLDVHFALPAASEYPRAHTLEVTQDEGVASAHEYLGDIHKHAKRYKRPAAMVHGPCFVRPRLVTKVAGYNGRFMSIMLPRLKYEKAAKVTRLPSLPASLAVRITFDHIEDTLIFAHEHQLLEAGDIVGRGHWCVVRRARDTGRLIHAHLHEGQYLRVAGRTVKTS